MDKLLGFEIGGYDYATKASWLILIEQGGKTIIQSIVHIALVVKDYDEAIEVYTKKLHFELVEDTYQPNQDKRWVVISPPGSNGTAILLARAFYRESSRRKGFSFLGTNDFWRDYNEMVIRGTVPLCHSIKLCIKNEERVLNILQDPFFIFGIERLYTKSAFLLH